MISGKTYRSDNSLMSKNSLIKPNLINALIASVYPAFSLLAAMQLDIFSYIDSDGKEAISLAKEMNLDARKIEVLLYSLVSAGLLQLRGNKFYNSEESAEFLVSSSSRFMGSSHKTYADLWSSTLLTAKSIEENTPQAMHDFSSMSEVKIEEFIMGLEAGAGATARRLHKQFNFSRFSSILDAGGGSGGLALEFSKLLPNIDIHVLELPLVAKIAARNIERRGKSGDIAVLQGDLAKKKCATNTYDAVILRSVIQVVGPKAAARIIKNTVNGVKAGGEIFVIGRILDNTRLYPKEAVAANVMFLNVYKEGMAYTIGEYESWFEVEGVVLKTQCQMAGGFTLLQFVKN